MLPVILLVALLGSYLGRKITDKISQPLFRRIVLVAIFLVAIKFVFDWFLA